MVISPASFRAVLSSDNVVWYRSMLGSEEGSRALVVEDLWELFQKTDVIQN